MPMAKRGNFLRPGRSSQTQGKMSWTKKRTNIEASRGLPSLSYQLYSHSERNSNMYDDLSCAREWTKICCIQAQGDVRTFARSSNVLDNPLVRFLFIIFILSWDGPWRGSVRVVGRLVRRIVRGLGPGVHGPGRQCFRVTAISELFHCYMMDFSGLFLLFFPRWRTASGRNLGFYWLHRTKSIHREWKRFCCKTVTSDGDREPLARISDHFSWNKFRLSSWLRP